ncbi:FecR family protein [Ilyomonas limi]|uniref:FecR family protein n=1 Tax=Ilyomonas limi TaxID=2575867 RepID=A0A4U3L2S2_9BACT|nr:FecR family protein [Ilyomonas limi]TKK69411.1 FecR family protein [Ilyomonas limi]
MNIKNFHLYEVTDFILDEDFMRWVYAPTAEDQAFWRNWLKQYPNKQLIIAEARHIVQSISIKPEKISNHEINEEVEKLLDTIHATEKPIAVSFIRQWRYVAAACFIILAGIGITGIYYTNRKNVEQFSYHNAVSHQHLIEQVNTSDKKLTVTLPDGSIVILSPDSRISYKNGFDNTDTRDVYLSGEAFFEVTKDGLHPFRVFANEIITKVLGTSFSISSFDKEKDIKVIVRTGKVSVYSQFGTSGNKTKIANKLDGIIITPNQQLTYNREQQKFDKELLDKPVIITTDITPKMMVYEETPLVKVLKDLRRAYGIPITYDADLLKNCTLTADLSGEALYTKLNMICTAIGGWYEVIDGQVIIHAAGC